VGHRTATPAGLGYPLPAMNHRRTRRIRSILVSLLLVVVAGWVSASSAPASAPASPAAASPLDARSSLSCSDLPRLMATYLQNHVLYRSVTDELRARTAESHLRMLDSSRSLFLEKEAEDLRKKTADLFSALSLDDCGILESMNRASIVRYREMEDFVRDFVSDEDYAIDEEAELVLDPDKRGFPKNKSERKALYEKLIHFQMSNYLSNGEPLADAKEKLIHRYELITKRAEEMTPDEIYARFLGAFANSLDPHSAYLTPDSLEDFRIHMGLSLEGIGAVLSSRDGYTVVEEIVPGGAADLSGALQPKDKLLSVGQESGEMVDVIDMDLRDVVRMIRGKKGTAVRLGVLRQGAETERFTVRLLRDKINLEEQAAKLEFKTLERDGRKLRLAVIDLPSFYGDKEPDSRQATEDVARLLDLVKREKADGLVLDLSRNGGGLLEYAVRVTGFFLKRGGVVAVGDSGKRNQVLEDPDGSILFAGPLVVLTSRVTASAAEILAGAVQDYRRGIVVGDDHTFGKGSVQTVAPLPAGLGALKLTTAMFFRPGGTSTQQSGVSADILLPSLTQIPDFGEAYQPYSLPPREIDRFAVEGAAGVNTSGGYMALEGATVERLRQLSEARTTASVRFAEVRKEIDKQRENQGVVKVADLLVEKSDDDADVVSTGDPAPITGDAAIIAPADAPRSAGRRTSPRRSSRRRWRSWRTWWPRTRSWR
jgi:carboxyl-terminal processing protease